MLGPQQKWDKMFVKVSRWKVSSTNKFMTSSKFDEFRTCEMCVHFHLLVFEFDCLPSNKWKKMRIVSPFWIVSSLISLQPNFSQRKTCASARILWVAMAATFQAFDPDSRLCKWKRQTGFLAPKMDGFFIIMEDHYP